MMALALNTVKRSRGIDILQSRRELRLRRIEWPRIVSLHFVCFTSASKVLQQNKVTPQINPKGNPVCSRPTVTPTMSRIT